MSKLADSSKRVLIAVARVVKDQWFDLSRNVRTSGDVLLQDAGISAEEIQDSERYQPTRPEHTRRALREMPVKDVSEFTYIDLGSGKGRTLFIAAEFPFKRIIGVEFSRRLHDDTCANIRSFRRPKRGCRDIISLHENAKDFVFPEGDLVVYIANPFGLATMQHVLANLEAAMRLHPRHVIIVLMWPRPGGGEQVATVKGMHLRSQNGHYQIYESQPG